MAAAEAWCSGHVPSGPVPVTFLALHDNVEAAWQEAFTYCAMALHSTWLCPSAFACTWCTPGQADHPGLLHCSRLAIVAPTQGDPAGMQCVQRSAGPAPDQSHMALDLPLQTWPRRVVSVCCPVCTSCCRVKIASVAAAARWVIPSSCSACSDRAAPFSAACKRLCAMCAVCVTQSWT